AVLAGAIIMMGLTWLNARLGAGGARTIASLSVQRMGEADASRRHAETVRSLGMEGRVNDRWIDIDTRYIAAQHHYSALAGILSTASRIFRQFLQSAVLTVGALLVIRGEATGGIIFASSILASRALAPVDQAIAHWRSFGAARDAWTRLNGLLATLPVRTKTTALPAPCMELCCEQVHIGPPSLPVATVHDISFRLTAGDGIGIIGPSGSGKSTLVRAIAGIWPPKEGTIRLDGASIDQWNADELGRHIGYMPQEAQLLDGTIAQNIGRFDPRASDEDIVAAARAAGAHDLILRLPQGYDTSLGRNGHALSGGQRQRISLARALLRDPFLLILDEPNAHLDNEGESALIHAIRMARARGAIVVVVAHRPVVMNALGHALYMEDGMMRDFGTRNDVLSRTLFTNRPPGAPAPAPMRVAASA
ncbi:MAG: type I secretion system permease/ATPase, partial [Rhizobiales bacterium 32-66-8]